MYSAFASSMGASCALSKGLCRTAMQNSGADATLPKIISLHALRTTSTNLWFKETIAQKQAESEEVECVIEQCPKGEIHP